MVGSTFFPLSLCLCRSGGTRSRSVSIGGAWVIFGGRVSNASSGLEPKTMMTELQVGPDGLC